MADRSSCEMHIGGTIKRSDLDRLIEVAAEEAGLDYESADEEEILQAAKSASAEKAPLHLSRCEVAWSTFQGLETMCRELGLHYTRHSEAYVGSWGEHIGFWQPGMSNAAEIEYPCGDYGEPMLVYYKIEELLAENRLAEVIAEMRLINKFPFPLLIVDD